MSSGWCATIPHRYILTRHSPSSGTLTPRAGSLYRLLGRLMVDGLVREVEAPAGTLPPHPWAATRTVPMEGRPMRSRLREWAGDLRLAARALKRAPGFTVVAVGTLALAIGVCAAMFSVVDTVLLHPLPYANADRLVYIAASAPGSDMPPEFGVAPEFYVEYKEQSRLLEDVAEYNSFTATLRTDDRVERVWMSWPTNSLFSTLGANPMLGRLPTASDGARAAAIDPATTLRSEM